MESSISKSRSECPQTSVLTHTQVLGLSHPAIDTRDTALFMPFRKSLKVKPSLMIPLSTLVHRLMGHHIGLNGEVAVSRFIARTRVVLTNCIYRSRKPEQR